jgi:hypothetical protein
MTNDTTTEEKRLSLARDSALKRLDRLVGTWKVEGRESDPAGEIHGHVSFARLEGGFFLLQRIDLNHGGRPIKGIEIIGHERPFGAESPSPEITSRVFDNEGNTLDYVYELEGETLTIWGGHVGSPATFKGTFSADGNCLTGRWVWSGGGMKRP